MQSNTKHIETYENVFNTLKVSTTLILSRVSQVAVETVVEASIYLIVNHFDQQMECLESSSDIIVTIMLLLLKIHHVAKLTAAYYIQYTHVKRYTSYYDFFKFCC